MKLSSRFFFVGVVIALALVFVALGPTTAVAEGTIAQASYGTTADGAAVDEYTLTNANGMEVKIITYGGIISSVRVPDRNGNHLQIPGKLIQAA